jgi:septal ring factor EnvC (AmiA/AmiB activator)
MLSLPKARPSFTRVAAARCVGLLLLLILAGAQAQDSDARKQEQAQTKAKLQQIRADIERESVARDAVKAEHASSNAALRDIERSVGIAARIVAETDTELAKRERDLSDLDSERQQLEARLAGQRLKLGALLRSAYVLGRDQHLRSWLARDRLADSARVAAYNQYLQQYRMRRMSGLLDELNELVSITQQVNQAKAELVARRTSSQSEIATLTLRRAEREQLLNELSAKLVDHQQRLQAYARDEKSLIDLLERLQDVLADIPRQITDALPLAQLRGKLPWPANGAVQTAFGTPLGPGRVSDGMVIAAKTGDEVHAVAHGRVAYADWLRGFGLLIIVDHGDGFMSLYAHNEALLRDEGDWVQAGMALARAGASGGAEQSGLYFELRKNGQPLDPRLWLQKR